MFLGKKKKKTSKITGQTSQFLCDSNGIFEKPQIKRKLKGKAEYLIFTKYLTLPWTH